MYETLKQTADNGEENTIPTGTENRRMPHARTEKLELEQFARQVGFTLAYFDELNSTNDTARNLQYDAGAVILAERQLNGRGQRGNSWSSTPGENLTFSLILCPDFLRADRQFYLSKAVALALTDTLESLGLETRIKWPNDIYLHGEKVAGILIENDMAGSYLTRSIAGIGLNVNQIEFDPTLPNPTSLALALGHTTDRADLFKRFYHHMSLRFGQLAQEHYQSLDADYIGKLYRFGEEHPFVDGKSGIPFHGTICGVLPTGELQVKHTNGEVRLYLFKEIEYRITTTR